MNIYEELQKIESKLDEQNRRFNLLLSEIKYMQMLLRSADESKVNRMEVRRHKEPSNLRQGSFPTDTTGKIEKPFVSNRNTNEGILQQTQNGQSRNMDADAGNTLGNRQHRQIDGGKR